MEKKTIQFDTINNVLFGEREKQNSRSIEMIKVSYCDTPCNMMHKFMPSDDI